MQPNGNTNADGRAGLSRARGAQVVGQWVDEWSDFEADVITAELVACTLGARRRPELRVDPLGRAWHALRQGVLRLQASVQPLMAELAAYRYPGAR